MEINIPRGNITKPSQVFFYGYGAYRSPEALSYRFIRESGFKSFKKAEKYYFDVLTEKLEKTRDRTFYRNYFTEFGQIICIDIEDEWSQ